MLTAKALVKVEFPVYLSEMPTANVLVPVESMCMYQMPTAIALVQVEFHVYALTENTKPYEEEK